jgi:hypothetical protein
MQTEGKGGGRNGRGKEGRGGGDGNPTNTTIMIYEPSRPQPYIIMI